MEQNKEILLSLTGEKTGFGEVIEEHYSREVYIKYIGNCVAYVRKQQKGTVAGMERDGVLVYEKLLPKEMNIREWEGLIDSMIEYMEDDAEKKATGAGEYQMTNIELRDFKLLKFVQAFFVGIFISDLFNEIVSSTPRGWAIILFVIAITVNIISFFTGRWKK